MNVLIGARNGDSRHDSAPPVVDLTLVTIISFPCQFCAPDVAHVGRVHSPVRFCLAGASLAPCSAPYVNMDSIGAIHRDSKTIRIYGPRFTAKILRKCVSASNSPFSIIFCISETRFFRSTISILHSNLHRHCEVSGQRQISCVSAAQARDCPREHSE